MRLPPKAPFSSSNGKGVCYNGVVMKIKDTTQDTILASELKPGHRIVNEHGFVQEVAAVAPHSSWGIRIITTYDRATGCPSQVVDKTVKLTLTKAEPHGKDNPF